MPGFYVLAVAVFAIPLSLLIGMPFWWAQCLVYASLAWSFVTSGGVYKIGAPAAAVLALGYGLRGLTTVDAWGQFPLLAHIPDPFLLMGIFGLLYLLTKLPYRSKNTWPGWLFIVMSILVTVFFYLGIFQATGKWPLISFIFAILKLMLFIAAIGLVQAAVEGKAPEGRFLWVVGLGLIWLTEFLVAAREGGLWNADFFNMSSLALTMLLLLCTGFVVLGSYAEGRNLKLGILPYIIGITGIELAWIFGAVGLQGTQIHLFLAWLVTGAVLLFVGMLILLNGYIAQRQRAEDRAREWEEFMTELTRLPVNPVPRPEVYLLEVWIKLKQILPSIRGLAIFSDPPLELGEHTPHSLDLDDGQRPIGVLYVDGLPGTAENSGWTTLLAEKIGRFIGEIRWQAEALLDPLTGLARRRPTIYEPIFNNAKAEQVPIAMLLLDIDYFKMINDTFGHAEGDRVLARLGEVLRRSVRGHDLPIRWGGEEFLIILWNTKMAEAIEVAERIRHTIQHDSELNITISAGISGGEIPSDINQIQNWVSQADQALYQAKEEGRNRVRIYSTSATS